MHAMTIQQEGGIREVTDQVAGSVHFLVDGALPFPLTPPLLACLLSR